MYSFTLPYPPSANHYLRRGTHGVYQTGEAAAYKQQAALEAIRAGVEPIEGALVVVLDFYRPAKRGDLDNLLKVILDSLNGVAWLDDSQIVEIRARLCGEDKQHPRAEVAVWRKGEPLPEDEQWREVCE